MHHFCIYIIFYRFKNSVTVLEDGKRIQVESVESGTLILGYGVFVAYEADDRCEHGFNCWEKSNAKDTIIETDEGYVAKGEEVEICITSNGALPWFLTDENAPELRIIGNEFEIMGVNGAWQRGTI